VTKPIPHVSIANVKASPVTTAYDLTGRAEERRDMMVIAKLYSLLG
jgi:hypothetical protein